MKQPAVYILENRKNGTLYAGVTSDLVRRIWEHKNGSTPGFAWTNGCTNLVWFEVHETMTSAIEREKQIKGGSRAAKVRLIMTSNPEWSDLYGALL